jgi:alanine dehydrogenase
MLIIPRSVVAELLSFDDVLPAVEAAHAELVTGGAAQADRQNLDVPGTDLLLVPMLAASSGTQATGLKLLVDAPGNPAHGAPRQQSTILLIDPATGRCEAVLDGAVITQFRTAAASAIATKHLAGTGATTLGLIGSGKLAWAHFAAVRRVRPIGRVLLWSRSEATAASLAERIEAEGVRAEIHTQPEAVVGDSEVVCTLTPSVEPIVAGAWLRPGQHLNVVGAPPRPTHREVDELAVARSRVVVDDRHVARAESGALRAALAAGLVVPESLEAELGEVIAGTRPGRCAPDDITLYNSVGVGIQDIVTARLVFDAAVKHGLGTDVALAE